MINFFKNWFDDSKERAEELVEQVAFGRIYIKEGNLYYKGSNIPLSLTDKQEKAFWLKYSVEYAIISSKYENMKQQEVTNNDLRS